MSSQKDLFTELKVPTSYQNYVHCKGANYISEDDTGSFGNHQESGTILSIPKLAYNGNSYALSQSSESWSEGNSSIENNSLPQNHNFKDIETNVNEPSEEDIASSIAKNSIKSSSSRRKSNVPKRKIPRKELESDETLLEKEVEKYLLKVPSFHDYYTEIKTKANVETDLPFEKSCHTLNKNDSYLNDSNSDFEYIMGDNPDRDIDNAELSPLQHHEIQENISFSKKNGITNNQKGTVTYIQNEIETNEDIQNEIASNLKLRNELQTNLQLQNEIEANLNSQNEKQSTLKIPSVFPKSKVESTKSKSKRVRCELCNKTFGRPSELKRHSVLHTGEKHHTCEECKKNFSQRYHLVRHVKNVHKKELENLVCGICNETFNSEYLLVRHVKRHGLMTFSCDVCNKEFKTKRQMKEHMLGLHAGIKPFQCTQCDKVFSRKYHLDRHVMIHTGIRDYQCEYCGKDFSTKGNLLAHVRRVHMKIKEFTCGVCDKGFFSPKDLQTHLKQHTGEKPYQCDICMKQFSEKVNMEWHLRIHSGERPYQCNVCEKSYTRMPHLIRHQREGLCARRAIHSSHWKTDQTTIAQESNSETGYDNSYSSDFDDDLEHREDEISENDDSCMSENPESNNFDQLLSNTVDNEKLAS